MQETSFIRFLEKRLKKQSKDERPGKKFRFNLGRRTKFPQFTTNLVWIKIYGFWKINFIETHTEQL